MEMFFCHIVWKNEMSGSSIRSGPSKVDVIYPVHIIAL